MPPLSNYLLDFFVVFLVLCSPATGAMLLFGVVPSTVTLIVSVSTISLSLFFNVIVIVPFSVTLGAVSTVISTGCSSFPTVVLSTLGSNSISAVSKFAVCLSVALNPKSSDIACVLTFTVYDPDVCELITKGSGVMSSIWI